jgi:type III pantothenate kinase
MILCLDIGNSFIKCAVVGADRVLGREKIETARFSDTTALPDLVKRVSGTVLSIDSAAVSSVVPQATTAAVSAVTKQLGKSPQVIEHSLRLPFALEVPDPSLIGTDRICAAAGALGTKGLNGIVIDAGSAITVDLVHKGAFIGGIILAGPSMVLESLHRYASQLPAIDLKQVDTIFPAGFGHTELAMALGAGLGCTGGIRASVKFLQSTSGVTPRKFLTGGQAVRLAPRLPQSWKYDPDLTFKGMYNIVLLNTRAAD